MPQAIRSLLPYQNGTQAKAATNTQNKTRSSIAVPASLAGTARTGSGDATGADRVPGITATRTPNRSRYSSSDYDGDRGAPDKSAPHATAVQVKAVLAPVRYL